ncbi:MAG: glucose 1-dehydrogenase [Chloroflexota bacterium]|nr:MAG: 2-deoxy-D-gluconate 3-dehydrogenase [Chloroflexota bacterium]
MAQPLSFDLTDKVVVVTGAGRGIGKAIAEACAHHGAHLALGSRTVEESEAVAEACRAMGRRAAAWQLDVARVDSIRAFVGQVLEAYGRIDVLVNNAGANVPKPALEYTEEEFDLVVDVNLKGVFFMSTAVAQSMVERGIAGSIIQITSQVGVVGGALRSVYSGAKGGVGNLSRALAAEWAPHNITVNCVAPTFTRTPMLERALQNPEFAKNLEKVPMGRTAEPEEIAAAVVFLASPAARMITGQVLCVDGGYTAV